MSNTIMWDLFEQLAAAEHQLPPRLDRLKDATIGFAGSRVIEDTIKEKLPQNFQKSEYLMEKGMVDLVVHRKNLKEKIQDLLDFLIT